MHYQHIRNESLQFYVRVLHFHCHMCHITSPLQTRRKSVLQYMTFLSFLEWRDVRRYVSLDRGRVFLTCSC